MNDRCELCGEEIVFLSTSDPGGEFWQPDGGDREFGHAIIAHAQCGIDAGLEPA